MADVIDRNVVEMVFDNSKFGAKIKETMGYLSNLKQNLKLDKAADEFDKLEKAADSVSFEGLYDNVDLIASRFTTMGVAGTTAIAKITNAAMNAGKTLVTKLSSQVIQGGITRALNLEQAQFQIEGLGYAWDAVREDVEVGVNDTAYGLDAAAKVAAQLLASGVQVGEQMQHALRGISGVAAMTNSTYEDIGQVFTTVAGNGRLMGDQLLQLSSRGINAAATLATAMGTSEQAVREMVSKGQIDFLTFATAMDNAFGEHAKDANETFSGSLSNVKSALSRIGAEFASPALVMAKDVFNAIRPAINGVKEALTPLINVAAEGMSFISKFVTQIMPDQKTMGNALTGTFSTFAEVISSLVKAIWNLGTAVSKVIGPILQAFSDAFGPVVSNLLTKAAKALEDFTSRLIMSDRMSENLGKTFKGIFDVLASLLDIVGKVAIGIFNIFGPAITTVFGALLDILLKITGFIGEVITNVKNLITDILHLDSVQFILEAIRKAFEFIGDIATKAVHAVQEFIYAFLDSAFTGAASLMTAIGDGLVFVYDRIRDVVQAMADWIDKVKQLPQVQSAISRVSDFFADLGSNVRQAAESLKTKLVNAFIRAKDAAGRLYENIRNLLSGYIELPSIEEAVAKVQQFVSDIFENSVEIFNNVKEVLGNVIDRVKELGGEGLGKAVQNFQTFKEKLSECVDESGKLKAIGDVLGTVRDAFGEVLGNIGDIFEKVKTKIAQFFRWITDNINGIDLGDILAVGVGASLVAFIISVTKLLNTFGKALEGIKKLPEVFDQIVNIGKNIVATLQSAQKYLKQKGKADIINSIAELVKSIALLAGALAVLSMMDQGKLWSSLGVITALIAVMGALIILTNHFASKSLRPSVMVGSSKMLLQMIGSLVLMVLSLKVLESVSLDGILERLAVLSIIMAELVAVFLITNRFGRGSILGKPNSSVLGISASLLLVALAMQKIASIPVSEMERALGVIEIIGLLMLAVTALSSRIKPGAAGVVIGFGTSMILLAASMKLIATMEWGEIAKAVFVMISVVGLMGTLIVATMAAGKNGDKAGAAIIGLGVSMGLIAVAMKIMGSLEASEIGKALVAVTGVVAIMSLFTMATKFAGKNGTSAAIAIMGMAGALIIISGAMLILAQIDEAGLKRATFVVDSIILMMSVLVAASKFTSTAHKSIITMSITVGLLAGVVAALAFLEPKNVITATACVDSLMAMAILMSNVKTVSKKALVGMLGMTAVVALLAGILVLLSNLNVDSFIDIAVSLGTLAISLSTATLILSKIGMVDFKGILAGIAGMSLVIAAMGLIMAAISGLNSLIPGLNDFLREAIPILQSIGEAIGTFFGSLVGSFVGTVTTSVFDSFITCFAKLGDALKSFSSATAGVDASSILNIIGAIVALTAADFLNAINILGRGQSIQTLVDNLGPLGTAMKTFGDNVAGTNLEAMKAGAEAAKYFGEMMASLPTEGGLKGLIFGDNVDFGSFGTQLASFGLGLKMYATAVEGLNSEAIMASIEPSKALIELAKILPETGGFIQWLCGEHDFAKFGTQLALYGKSLKKFSEAITEGDGIQTDAINEIIEPSRSLIELAKILPETDGLIQFIVGQKDLGKFGTKLAEFGKSLHDFSESISGDNTINTDAIKDIIEPVQALIDLNNQLPEMDSVINWFVGSKDLGTFGNKLKQFGEALVSYATSVEGLTTDVAKKQNLENSINIMRNIVEISNMLEGTKGFFDSEINLSDLGGYLTSFAKGMVSYSTEIAKIENMSGITSSVGAAKALCDIITHSGEATVGAIFTSGLLGATFADSMKYFGAGLAEYVNAIKDVGDNINVISSTKDGVGEFLDIIDRVPEILNAFGESALAGYNSDTFIAACSGVGAGLNAFGDSIKDLKGTEKIGVAIELADGLVDVMNKVPSYFDAFTKFANNDDTFVTACTAIATGLNEFSSAISKMPDISDKVGNVDKVVDILTSLASTDFSGLKNVGDYISDFAEDYGNFIAAMTLTGENQATAIETFSLNMSKIADALGKLYMFDFSGLQDLTTTFTTIGSSFVSAFVDNFATDEAGNSSIGDAITEWVQSGIQQAAAAFEGQKETLSELFTNVCGAMSMAITDQEESIDGAMQAIVDSMLGVVVENGDSINNAGVTFVEAMQKGIDDTAESLAKSTEKAVDDSLTAAGKKKENFYSLGKDIITAIKKGINDNASSVAQAINAALVSAKDNADTSGFYSIGANAVSGVASGMANNAYKVQQQANALASTIASAMNKGLDINSPSRVLMETGIQAVEGLVVGMEKSQGWLKNKSSQTASVISSTMATALSVISEESEKNLTLTPTITPVVDYSNVYGAAGLINNLYGSRSTLDAARVASAYGRNQAFLLENQNGSQKLAEELSAKLDNLNDNISEFISEEAGKEFALYLDNKEFARSNARAMNNQLGILQRRGGLSYR